MAIGSASGLHDNNNPCHHSCPYHHCRTTSWLQENTSYRRTKGADLGKNCPCRWNDTIEHIAAHLSSTSSADHQHQRGPSSGSSCYHHQCRRWADARCFGFVCFFFLQAFHWLFIEPMLLSSTTDKYTGVFMQRMHGVQHTGGGGPHHPHFPFWGNAVVEELGLELKFEVIVIFVLNE